MSPRNRQPQKDEMFRQGWEPTGLVYLGPDGAELEELFVSPIQRPPWFNDLLLANWNEMRKLCLPFGGADSRDLAQAYLTMAAFYISKHPVAGRMKLLPFYAGLLKRLVRWTLDAKEVVQEMTPDEAVH